MCVCVFVLCACSAYRSRKKAVDPLGPEIYAVMSHCVGAGIQTQIFKRAIRTLNHQAICQAPDLVVYVNIWEFLFILK